MFYSQKKDWPPTLIHNYHQTSLLVQTLHPVELIFSHSNSWIHHSNRMSTTPTQISCQVSSILHSSLKGPEVPVVVVHLGTVHQLPVVFFLRSSLLIHSVLVEIVPVLVSLTPESLSGKGQLNDIIQSCVNKKLNTDHCLFTDRHQHFEIFFFFKLGHNELNIGTKQDSHSSGHCKPQMYRKILTCFDWTTLQKRQTSLRFKNTRCVFCLQRTL